MLPSGGFRWSRALKPDFGENCPLGTSRRIEQGGASLHLPKQVTLQTQLHQGSVV